jgi:uncharacterized protein (DUF1697 family)
MTTWVALLRGVNVGGHTVKMGPLKALFAELGLERVRSYIASGNVFFDAPGDEDRGALTERIEAHLEDSLGWPCAVMLRTMDELEAVVAADPFAGIEKTDDNRFYVLFLAEPLPDDAGLPLRSPKGDVDVLSATPGEAFAVVHRTGSGVGDANAFLAKTLGVRSTGRFWHTTAKILDAARKES